MTFFKNIFGNAGNLIGDIENINKIDTVGVDAAKLAVKIDTNKIAQNVKVANNVDNIKDNAQIIDNNAEKVNALSKNSKIIDWIKKNPGSTVGAAAASVFGAAAVSVASQDYDDNNNKILTIVSMSQDKNSNGVIINYTPEAKFIYGDKIEIQQSNMIPSHENDIFIVNTFPTSTSITVNIPDIKTYATSGTIILKTTMTGRVLNSSGELAATAGGNINEAVSNSPIQTIIDYFKSLLYNIFGPYLKLFQGCCLCICCLIILIIFYKIIKIFI